MQANMVRAGGLFLALALGAPAVATAQTISAAPYGGAVLYYTGTLVGNGADTTEDVLQTYTLPAGKLANVGDTVHIVASGTLAATTDTKTIRLRMGGVSGIQLANPSTSVTGAQAWAMDIWITKSGANAQTVTAMAPIRDTALDGIYSTARTVTDTNTIQLVVTGQNSTSASANSVTCQTMMVEFIPGP